MSLEIYEAKVTRNTDPDIGEQLRGAVFFQCDQLLEDQEFPVPAEPIFPHEWFDVPNVDDWIEIEIDTSKEKPEPRWRCVLLNLETEMPEEFATNYPFRKGIRTKAGHYLIFDDSDDGARIALQSSKGKIILLDDNKNTDAITIYNPSGGLVQIDKNGSIKILANGNLINLDAEENAVSVISKNGSSISLSKDINLVGSTGKEMITMSEDGKIGIISSGEVNVNGKSFSALVASVVLGKPEFRGVLYENLKTIFDAHIHATGVGPSGPPLPPNTCAIAELAPPTSPAADYVKLRGNL